MLLPNSAICRGVDALPAPVHARGMRCPVTAARVTVRDIAPELNREKLGAVQIVAQVATEQLTAGADWRPAAAAVLADLFPRGWVYRGGRHLAQHASPPRNRLDRSRQPKEGHGQAGPLLCTIAEGGVL